MVQGLIAKVVGNRNDHFVVEIGLGLKEETARLYYASHTCRLKGGVVRIALAEMACSVAIDLVVGKAIMGDNFPIEVGCQVAA